MEKNFVNDHHYTLINQLEHTIDTLRREREDYRDEYYKARQKLQELQHLLARHRGETQDITAITKSLLNQIDDLQQELSVYRSRAPASHTYAPRVNPFNSADVANEGAKDRNSGKPQSANPYPLNSAISFAWAQGWMQQHLLIQLRSATSFLINEENNIIISKRGDKWIITGYDNLILTKEGEWIKQPLMRESSPEFLDATRFDTYDDAYERVTLL